MAKKSFRKGPPRDNRGKKKEIKLENAKFERYYKTQKIIPEEEWENFMATLREPLPTNFRVGNLWETHEEVCKKISTEFQFDGTVTCVGKEVAAPHPLPWYRPENHAWQIDCCRNDLRKEPTLKNIHRFLVQRTAIGDISRQEAVSMVPPLMLDVKPHHVVLDMCASPGSKTVQLMEMLHANDHIESPSGLVVANDADSRRAYMLVCQCKRLGSPNLMVTTHDASHFPELQFTEEENVKGAGMFDRILCDVPCSGDGTLRKSVTSWKKWSPKQGRVLHNLQSRIAIRGARLLKVGGLMVYSTCSMNPLENEAVITEIISKTNGALEIVDASEIMPELIRRPGMAKWTVFDDKMNEHHKRPEAGNRGLRPSYFPTEKPELADSIHLERCMRFYPHLQNTGGFFVTVLRKVNRWPCGPDASEVAETETKVEGETSPITTPAGAASPTSPPLKRVCVEKEIEEKESEVEVVATTEVEEKKPEEKKEEEAKMEIDEGKVVATVTGKEAKSQKTLDKEAKMGPNIHDHYRDIDDDVWEMLQTYYGLTPEFARNQLQTRSDQAAHITFVSEKIRDLLKHNTSRKLKTVNCGLKIFDRIQGGRSDVCPFRLSQEGVHLVLPFMTKRVVSIPLSDVRILMNGSLKRELTGLSKLSQEGQDALTAFEPGCIALTAKEIEAEWNCKLTIAFSALQISMWRGPGLMNIHLNKEHVDMYDERLQAVEAKYASE